MTTSETSLVERAMVRKVGAALAPDAGPTKCVFFACVASARVRVPEPVTGEPVTVKMDGAASPTDATVPGWIHPAPL